MPRRGPSHSGTIGCAPPLAGTLAGTFGRHLAGIGRHLWRAPLAGLARKIDIVRNSAETAGVYMSDGQPVQAAATLTTYSGAYPCDSAI